MEDFMLEDLNESLTDFGDVIKSMPSKSDEMYYKLWQDASLFCFLRSTDILKDFLADYSDNDAVLDDNAESLEELERVMNYFRAINYLSEEQFMKFGDLFTSGILLQESAQVLNEEGLGYYNESLNELPHYYALMKDFATKLTLEAIELSKETDEEDEAHDA